MKRMRIRLQGTVMHTNVDGVLLPEWKMLDENAQNWNSLSLSFAEAISNYVIHIRTSHLISEFRMLSSYSSAFRSLTLFSCSSLQLKFGMWCLLPECNERNAFNSFTDCLHSHHMCACIAYGYESESYTELRTLSRWQQSGTNQNVKQIDNKPHELFISSASLILFQCSVCLSCSFAHSLLKYLHFINA